MYRKATMQFVVVVIVTPQLIIDEPMVTTTYGKSAQLTCSHANPDANPIRIQWYKSGIHTAIYWRKVYG